MFNRFVVSEALKHSVEHGSTSGRPYNSNYEKASLISLLIHDIFGGEILKTRLKKGWHFYNRVEGKRFDFTGSDISKYADDTKFEDIPSTPDEICNYFEDTEYSNFLMRFVWAFEEAVGLEKYQTVLPS
jgi:hypothetical protein